MKLTTSLLALALPGASAFSLPPSKATFRTDVLKALPSKEGQSEKVTRRNIVVTDCDNSNTPPSLSKIVKAIDSIKSGSDIRGTFTDHLAIGTILNVSQVSVDKALTPFAAYCYGAAFAQMVQIRSGKGSALSYIARNFDEWGDEGFLKKSQTVISVGRDPRNSGVRLADAFCRGLESVDGVTSQYTGIASTPAMFEFCRSNKCDGSVMITASHLPEDRNGMKFFTKNGGLTKADIEILADGATKCACHWYDIGILPPSSGKEVVFCSSLVNYMPSYEEFLRNAILHECGSNSKSSTASLTTLPLSGLRIVLNAGNGSGYFFNKILKDLGADVSNSIHLTPDGTFPASGVPNPEYSAMIDETKSVCEECEADIGIMLDTDADRCGFIVPRSDGTTLRYETSGHCAMRENGYLDVGKYTAVKVIGLLAKVKDGKSDASLLDLISDLEE